MSNYEWSHIGDDIMDAVQTAIEDGDFTNLSTVLNDSANLAMDKFQDALTGNTSHRYVSTSRYKGSDYKRYQRDTHRYQQSRSQASGQNAYGGQDHYNRTRTTTQDTAYRTTKTTTTFSRNYGSKIASALSTPFQKFRDRFRAPGSLSMPGYLAAIIGGVVGGSFVMADLVLLGMAIEGISGSTLALFLMLPFAAAGVGACIWGVKRLSLLKKYKRYVSVIGDQTHYSIRELAAICNTTKEKLLQDLKKIIGKGWFKQGHITADNSEVILTNEVFRQYRQMENERQRKIIEEKSKKVGQRYNGVGGKDGVNLSKQATASYMGGESYVKGPQPGAPEAKAQEVSQNTAGGNISPTLPEEARTVIMEGREYLRRIIASNEAIPGEEISNKISRLERIIDQIFDRVEQHPELVDDLRRFMKYYLPTTVKLLDAYEELDRQEVQGPNIMKSKADIEETLDTINQAFENLLDGFFATSVVDIASDISVMQTLMSQEGLLGDNMKADSSDIYEEEPEEEEEEDFLKPQSDPIQEYLNSNM